MAVQKRDWRKAQPHNASNGRIVKRSYAEKYPRRVVWVKVKKR